MRKTTKWSPDTCKCVISYSWDDALPADDRVLEPETAEACEAHQALADVGLIYEAVLVENRTKNLVREEILNSFPALSEDFTSDGQTMKRFRPGIEFEYSFDPERQLTVNMRGANLTVNERDSIRTSIETIKGNLRNR